MSGKSQNTLSSTARATPEIHAPQQAEATGSDERYIIRIERKPELKAIERSSSNFEEFDVKLREEILRNASSASIEEEMRILLPPCPERKENDKKRSLARPLQEYLDAVFRMPSAVHSEALASFLALSDTPDISDSSSQHHMYLDYLLPSAVEEGGTSHEPFRAIPRGALTRTVETLLPGWWVVWRFQMESGNNAVEFSLYIDKVSRVEENDQVDDDEVQASKDPDNGGAGSEEPEVNVSMESKFSLESTGSSDSKPSNRELVHRELCSSSDEPICGSYRFPPNVPEGANATFEFKNVTKLSRLRGSRVRLECAAIPHEAFRAACEAARDQNDADARRLRSPLLYAVLDSPQNEKEDGGIFLSVEAHPESGLNETGVHGNSCESLARVLSGTTIGASNGGTSDEMSDLLTKKDEELDTLREEVSKLHRERDFVRDELARITTLADDGKRTLQLMVSEKRVWSVAREEIQGELSRLSNDYNAERDEKSELRSELETAKQEVKRLREEVIVLKKQIPSDQEVKNQKEILRHAQSTASEMKVNMLSLKEEVDFLKRQKAGLEAQVKEKSEAMEEQASKAKSEVDEARMLQRILEGKVRHLEQEVRRAREGSTQRSRAKTSRRFLDPSVESFQHPNERLNQQLCSLRERHAQLADMLEKNPNNPTNIELVGKIEKAIHDIVESGGI